MGVFTLVPTLVPSMRHVGLLLSVHTKLVRNQVHLPCISITRLLGPDDLRPSLLLSLAVLARLFSLFPSLPI